ncbi:BLUF domain-containing protein [Leisingera aquimarina]|uniref:BLUF domain-containing protein n=1 Tax=Leisingera aquimarina TaxID=476529 RepID=UPI000407F4E2|nr:BLUF domain-containing protein [Leisingera aquimarina]
MHRLTLTAQLTAGTSHQQIAQFISRNRPAFRDGGATGMMIRSGEEVHFILEGPEAALQNTVSQAKSSPLFVSADVTGAMPIRSRAFDKIYLSYAKAEHLASAMRREVAMLTGLAFSRQALAA